MASGFTGPAATALQETETARQHFFLSSDIRYKRVQLSLRSRVGLRYSPGGWVVRVAT